MMQFAAFALAALASAGAQASAPDVPLGAFPDYGHPEITADNCTNKGPDQTECLIPAKTAGRYLVVAAGTATASGPDAVQELALGGPYWQCGQPVVTKKGDWTSGERTLVAQCIINVLNDKPLAVVAVFKVAGAKADPKGPVITIRRLPWNGVLDATGYTAGIKAAGAPPAGGGDK